MTFLVVPCTILIFWAACILDQLLIAFQNSSFGPFVSEHYNKWQENNLILPILILIKTSPNALGEFLNGDWVPRDDKFCQDNLIGPYESILDKLLFLTIGDLSTVRSYPKNDMINRVSIRPQVLKLNGDEDEELLECTYDGNLKNIYFDTRFSIRPNDPGNWKIVDRGHSYSPDILEQLNNIIQHISDFSVILNYLKDSEKPVSRILSKYLSIETKNLIKYCDLSENIPINFQIKLKYEIMEALVNEDWSELLTFGYNELSSRSKKELDKHLKIIESHDRLKIFVALFRIELGQAILKDVFKNAFDFESCLEGVADDK